MDWQADAAFDQGPPGWQQGLFYKLAEVSLLAGIQYIADQAHEMWASWQLCIIKMDNCSNQGHFYNIVEVFLQ